VFYVVLFGVFAFLALWNADPFMYWMEETMKWSGPLRSSIAILLLGVVPASVIIAGGVLSMSLAEGRRRRS